MPEEIARHSSFNVYPNIQAAAAKTFEPNCLEVHPFLISWYNELVGKKFVLDYPPETLALVIISGPEVFEKCVLPYLRSKSAHSAYSTNDPLDESMKEVFKSFADEMKKRRFEVEVFHDFELHPSRRPKILVQTAAHVAGGAEYFNQEKIIEKASNPQHNNQKAFGVAIHPEFGGWFAIRGVVVIKNVVLEDKNELPRPERRALISDEEKIVQIMKEFSFDWKRNLWRDVFPSNIKKKYSQDFIDYLDTHPGKRWEFIMKRGYVSSQASQ